MTRKRWLIIGASGYVGGHLRRRLGDGAVATYHRSPFPGGVRFDGTAERLSDRILRDHPDLEGAFILQAMARIDDCARDPAASRAVNVEAVRRIVEDLAAAGVVPVFTSSDAVLDGNGHLVIEAEPARPLMLYGRQKAEIEDYLASRPERSITLRLSKVMGADRHPSNLISGWLDDIEQGKTIRCATDQVFSPILAEDVADCLVALVECGGRGLFNLGGPEPLPRRAFLDMVVAAAADHRSIHPRIEPCRLNDLPFLERRPLDQSMDSGKLTAVIGRTLTPMAPVCRRAAAARYGAS